MKQALPIVLVVITAALMVVSLTSIGQAHAHGTVGIAAGSAMYGLTPKGDTPEQALTNLLVDVQRHNWDVAVSRLWNASANENEKQSFIQDWAGSNGSLRSFSNLEGFDLRPMHITNDEAQMRAHLHWSTPVGPVDDVRDFNLHREGDIWKPAWPKDVAASVPAQ